MLIRNVTVVEPRDGRSTPGQDVLVEDGHITAVGPQQGDSTPGSVDGAGQYLVPGFNDMHAHPLAMKDPAASLNLMLAFGVTGFRQMSGSAALLRRRAGGVLLPADSPRLLATPGAIMTPLNAATPEAATAAVTEQKDQGADFIKAGLMSPEAFYAAQREAARLGIPILGHLPGGVDVYRACGEGMASIEHLGPGAGLLSCCTAGQDDAPGPTASVPRLRLPPARLPFVETIFEAVLRRIVLNPVNLLRQPDVDGLELACTAFDEQAAGRLAQRLAAAGTWQVPTLIRSKTNYTCDDPAFPADPNLRYVAPATRKSWAKATSRFSQFPAASRQTFRLVYATMLRLARLLDEAGVPMLAGSDACGAAWEVPGASLHQEFDELARTGLTPLRILQMTTSDAARFLGAGDFGSVRAGQRADLVLLDADPLESAGNLHRVRAVVRDGRLYDRGALDKLKDSVASGRPVR